MWVLLQVREAGMIFLLLISLLTHFRFLQLVENMFDSRVFLFILRLLCTPVIMTNTEYIQIWGSASEIDKQPNTPLRPSSFIDETLHLVHLYLLHMCRSISPTSQRRNPRSNWLCAPSHVSAPLCYLPIWYASPNFLPSLVSRLEKGLSSWACRRAAVFYAALFLEVKSPRHRGEVTLLDEMIEAWCHRHQSLFCTLHTYKKASSFSLYHPSILMRPALF